MYLLNPTLVISSLVSCLAFFSFSGYSEANKNEQEPKKKHYQVAVNGVFTIELDSNPSTGYTWQWMNQDSVTSVERIGQDFVSDNPKLVGNSGRAIWKFQGRKPGTDTLDLEYKRPWDKNSTIDSTKIVVTVK